jgi:hypothetical protein
MTRLPSQNDLAIAPELGVLAALRVALQLTTDTLGVVHPLDELPTDPEQLAAHAVVFLAEALRVAVLDYEALTAGRS